MLKSREKLSRYWVRFWMTVIIQALGSNDRMVCVLRILLLLKKKKTTQTNLCETHIPCRNIEL